MVRLFSRAGFSTSDTAWLGDRRTLPKTPVERGWKRGAFPEQGPILNLKKMLQLLTHGELSLHIWCNKRAKGAAG